MFFWIKTTQTRVPLPNKLFLKIYYSFAISIERRVNIKIETLRSKSIYGKKMTKTKLLDNFDFGCTRHLSLFPHWIVPIKIKEQNDD